MTISANIGLKSGFESSLFGVNSGFDWSLLGLEAVIIEVAVELAISPINRPYCPILSSDISGSNVRLNTTEPTPPITEPSRIAFNVGGILNRIICYHF